MKINTEIITALNPCEYMLSNYLIYYRDLNGTHEDFLWLKEISHCDKLWVILRLMPIFEVEVFAIDCATQAPIVGVYAAASATYAGASTSGYSADYTANSAATAATAAVYAAASADTERERQVEALIYLINNSGEII